LDTPFTKTAIISLKNNENSSENSYFQKNKAPVLPETSLNRILSQNPDFMILGVFGKIFPL